MRFKIKQEIGKYGLLTIALFIAALSFNIFILPLKIVLGGNNGVAVLLEYMFEIKPSVTLTGLSVFFLILSYFFLDKKQTISIIYASFAYPVLVNITYPISRMLSLNITDILLASIYIGLISGFTNGMILKLGFNNGGINVISNIFYKYFKIAYSRSMFIINAILVIIGGIYFGWENVLYAILILYINSYVVDLILLKKSKYKCFEIITEKNDLIEEYIQYVLKRNYTKILLKNEKILIMTVIKTKEYIRLKEFLKSIDPTAFFLIRDSYDAKITY